VYAWLVLKLIRLGYAQVVAGRPQLFLRLAADDVEFVFPGDNSFAGSYRGKAQLGAWLERFASLQPKFTVHDVMVSGPPWNTRVAVRFSDAIGADYRNDGMEQLQLRWGRLHRVEVFLNTETIHAWEDRHPEIAAAHIARQWAAGGGARTMSLW
jgi:ketosteroid isomerase-like protein